MAFAPRLFAPAVLVALMFIDATALADGFDGEWDGRLGPARRACPSLELDELEVSAAVTGGYVALDIVEPSGRTLALEGEIGGDGGFDSSKPINFRGSARYLGVKGRFERDRFEGKFFLTPGCFATLNMSRLLDSAGAMVNDPDGRAVDGAFDGEWNGKTRGCILGLPVHIEVKITRGRVRGTGRAPLNMFTLHGSVTQSGRIEGKVSGGKFTGSIDAGRRTATLIFAAGLCKFDAVLNRVGAPPAVAAAEPAVTLESRLAVLRDLVGRGLITDRDYAQRKKALLDQAVGGAAPAPSPPRISVLPAVPKAPPSIPQARPPDADGLPRIPEVASVASAAISFGRYFALVIGNNDYAELPKLQTAVRDAEVLSELLSREYGFQVTRLLNATRHDILTALAKFRRELEEGDNLLLYYAGHGVLDEQAETGYWLPVDAEPGNPANWIANSDITVAARSLIARHVLVVADSCYSGSLVRAAPGVIGRSGDRTAWLRRIAAKRSRTVLTSGGLEPVLDGGGGPHSVFASALIQALNENQGILDGQQLFTQVQRRVVVNSDQTPEYSDIRRAGHDGGDFIFVRGR